LKAVYNLSNLSEATRLSKPARLAVIGFPVSHSASPKLHQPALDAFGINASYIRLEVLPGEIPQAFAQMRKLNFIGCNITVPHKFEAMAACSSVAPDAETIGAVNTVCFSENSIHGHNTDGPGFLRAIDQAFRLDCGKIHTLIIGAGGGAGQAIATQCALVKPAKLTLVNRSIDKIEALANRLRTISPLTEITTLTIDDPALKKFCHSADLLVQTTSIGLSIEDPPVIPEDCFLPRHCAFDTIYKPSETPFLATARMKGCNSHNGLSLLIHQGAIAFQLWFPDTDPLPHMLRSLNQ
jgi:shikimate dehydrogenase